MSAVKLIFVGSIAVYIGTFQELGLVAIAGLAIIGYGLYIMFSEGLHNSSGSSVKFKKLTIYPDEGYLKCGRHKVELKKVRNVQLEQRRSGYFGGGLATIDIMTNDFKTPYLSTRISALTRNGLNAQYQKICILLNCTDTIY